MMGKNIQEEVNKILHQYGHTEMGLYKIQLLFDEQEKGKWIPVNEKLPEKGIQVLVKNKYGVCDVNRLLNHGWDKDFEIPYTHWRPV